MTLKSERTLQIEIGNIGSHSIRRSSFERCYEPVVRLGNERDNIKKTGFYCLKYEILVYHFNLNYATDNKEPHHCPKLAYWYADIVSFFPVVFRPDSGS